MKQTETAQLLAVIKTAFPNFLVTEQAAHLWHEYLKDIPFQRAQKNLQEHIRSNRFPPVVADIVRHDSSNTTHIELLQLETSEKEMNLTEWERKATSMPEHLRLKRGVAE